jgi:hypothetical protein
MRVYYCKHEPPPVIAPDAGSQTIPLIMELNYDNL